MKEFFKKQVGKELVPDYNDANGLASYIVQVIDSYEFCWATRIVYGRVPITKKMNVGGGLTTDKVYIYRPFDERKLQRTDLPFDTEPINEQKLRQEHEIKEAQRKAVIEMLNTGANQVEVILSDRPSTMKKGISDVIALIRGKLYCIEIKIGRDEIRESQEEFKKSIIQAGGKYYIIKSAEYFIEEFVEKKILF